MLLKAFNKSRIIKVYHLLARALKIGKLNIAVEIPFSLKIIIIVTHEYSMSKPKFRLNAKRLYLKYDGLNKIVTNYDILKGLNPKLKIKEYLIALRSTEENRTAHVILLLEKRCNITKPASFNLKINDWKPIEGVYQTAQDYKALCKGLILVDDNYLTNMPLFKKPFMITTEIEQMDTTDFSDEEKKELIEFYNKLKLRKKDL